MATTRMRELTIHDSDGVLTELIYEGSLFSVIGGGCNHLAGLASALSRLNVPTTVVTPTQISDIELDPTTTHICLSARGSLPVRLLDYELAKIRYLWKQKKSAASTLYLSRLSTVAFSTWLARWLGYQVVVEVNGPIPLEVRDRLGRFGPVAGAIVGFMVKTQLRSAHKIVCVSGSLDDYVRTMLPNADVLILPNGAAPPSSSESASQEGHAEKLAGTQGMRFCYLGAITEWYDLDLLEDAVKKQGAGAHFHVVGDGPLLDKTKRVSGRTNWGWLGSTEATEILQACDVGVIPANPSSDSAALRSPLKLYHYLSAGVVVVAADIIEIEPELAPYVVTYKAGDINDLTSALQRAREIPRGSVPKRLWSWDSRARTLCEWVGIKVGRSDE